MIRLAASLGAALLLSSCATLGGGEGDAGYLDQVPYRETYETPLAVAAALVGNYPETTEAGPTMQLNLAPLDGNPEQLVLVVAIEPLLDDSISAEEWRAVISQEESLRWRLEELGLRRKCSRGPDNGQWGPNICP